MTFASSEPVRDDRHVSVPELVGESVTLRALRPQDRAARQRHGWHAEIERGYGASTVTRAMSDDDVEEWYAHWELAAAEANRIHWVLEFEGGAVGAVFLHAINAEDRRARYAIGLYHPSFFGRGLGQQATRLVLHHAFETLMLHRVDLRVLDFNHRAIASYRACGFVEEGREREVCFLDGRWHDDVVMAVLEHEFPASRARCRP
jgi:ribosomal-protein-alanine N-acetyltransferase